MVWKCLFFKSRVGFDVTYYHTNTVDQIIPVATSTATGYHSKFVNAGNIENKGIELSLYWYSRENSKFLLECKRELYPQQKQSS